jgi:hypothetical protein
MSQTSIERMVMAKIYTAALYPNGQIDVQRDQYESLSFIFMDFFFCFIEFSVVMCEHLLNNLILIIKNYVYRKYIKGNVHGHQLKLNFV